MRAKVREMKELFVQTRIRRIGSTASVQLTSKVLLNEIILLVSFPYKSSFASVFIKKFCGKTIKSSSFLSTLFYLFYFFNLHSISLSVTWVNIIIKIEKNNKC